MNKTDSGKGAGKQANEVIASFSKQTQANEADNDKENENEKENGNEKENEKENENETSARGAATSARGEPQPRAPEKKPFGP